MKNEASGTKIHQSINLKRNYIAIKVLFCTFVTKLTFSRIVRAVSWRKCRVVAAIDVKQVLRFIIPRMRMTRSKLLMKIDKWRYSNSNIFFNFIIVYLVSWRQCQGICNVSIRSGFIYLNIFVVNLPTVVKLLTLCLWWVVDVG